MSLLRSFWDGLSAPMSEFWFWFNVATVAAALWLFDGLTFQFIPMAVGMVLGRHWFGKEAA